MFSVKCLNSKLPNIKFTMEKESNKFLPFLDVLVKNESSTFTTSVCRKKTTFVIFTQYNSFNLPAKSRSDEVFDS